jgi:hypothetical protein
VAARLLAPKGPTLALLASPIVRAATSDDELAARQSALQNEAAELLDELDQSKIFSDIGPLEVTGSYISHLMCWRELDVMLLAGPDFGPRDVLNLISRVMELPGIVGFDYRDERAERSSTGLVKEERYHVPILLHRRAGLWCLDLSLWLHDLHENVTAWHRELRSRITDEQRAAVLRIKDVWFRLPSYPDQIGGFEIYAAVIDDNVRTPEEFRRWLVDRELLDV